MRSPNRHSTFHCCMRITMTVAAVALLAVAAHAATINVPADQPTIQAAIDAATAGDIINVAPGTYRENVVWDNKDLTIVGSGISVINADIDSNGTGDGRCLTATNLSFASSITGFTFENGVAPTANNVGGGVFMSAADVQMSNCEITDCSAASGGGLCVFNSGLAFIEDCSIHDCSATNWGGGIYGVSGPGVVTGCTVSANSANYGGGMRFGGTGTGALVSNCMIYSNEAAADGGGVSLQEAPVNFEKNILYDNLANRGGAMYLYGAAATIYGNLIYANLCNIFPAGISCLNSPATIEGNTIANNDDGGVSNGTTIATSPLIVKNNILYGNMSLDLSGTNFTSTYNCVGTGTTTGTGVITSDPLFADPTNGDFHLQSSQGRWNGTTFVTDAADSPAIDAGDPASPYHAEPAPNGSRRNLGAYGHTAQASLTGDGSTPSVAAVAITPDPAFTDDTLTAIPGTWYDPNGDPEGYDYQWALWDGAVYQDIAGATTNTLASGEFAKGDMVQVTIWPNDGTNVGLPVSDDITISNSPPAVTSVAITPDPADPSQTLTATPTGWSDPDGDPEGYDWVWEVDTGGGFAAVAGATTNTLAPANFGPGNQVRVTATPNDGTDTGAAVQDTITIGTTFTLTIGWAGAGTVLVNGTPQTLPYSGDFPVGDTVSVQSVPDSGWRLDQWSGDVADANKTDDPLAMLMDQNRSINPHFEQDLYTLTVGYAGAGTILVNGTPQTLPYSGSFPAGDTVSVQAVPDAGWRLDLWSGDVADANKTDDPLAVLMDQDRSINPHFERDLYTLTIGWAGAGTVLVNGTPQTLPYTGSFPAGDSVSVTSVPDSGWELDKWSGDIAAANSHDDPLQVLMDQDRSVNPHFRMALRTLTIGWAGAGTVLVNGTPQTLPYSGSFPVGDPVNIQSVPDSGWELDKWSGDIATANSHDDPLQVVMDQDRTVNPHFRRDLRTLTIGWAGAGTILVNGTPQTLPYTGSFPTGEAVSVTSVPDVGWELDKWSGDIAAANSHDDPLQVVMDQDRTVNPHFRRDLRTLTIEYAGAGTVLVNGTPQALPYTGQFAADATVAIDAVPNSGWTFDRWTGDLSSGQIFDDPLDLVMDQDRTIDPHFMVGGTGSAQLMSMTAQPTSSGAEISFTLSSTASVSVEVLNIAGRTVKHVVTDRLCDAGVQSLGWNGMSDYGTRAPNGSYMIRVTAFGADGARSQRLSTLQLR